MQVFLQRRIAHDAAEDLLQRTFACAVKKIRTEGLDDPSNLGGYLYRTARNLATRYWQQETARQHDGDGELLSNLPDEALSLEERLGQEQLADYPCRATAKCWKGIIFVKSLGMSFGSRCS